jgi:hypothetical protein
MQLIVLAAPGGDAEWLSRLVEVTGWPLEKDSIQPDSSATVSGATLPAERIGSVNKRIFSALQSAWFHVDNLPLGGEPYDLPHDVKRRIEDGGERLSQWKHWTCDDPAMCVLSAYWREHLTDPFFVLCVEHPCDVAARLRRTWQFPIAFGLALWEYYMRAALSNTLDVPRLIISRETGADGVEEFLQALHARMSVDRERSLQADTVLLQATSPPTDISPRYDPQLIEFLSNAQADLYRALCNGTVDPSGGAMSLSARDMLQFYGRLRAGFNAAREERDALKRRALRLANPTDPAEERSGLSAPTATASDVGTTELTVYLHGMEPLELSCAHNDPIVETLLQALGRSGNSDASGDELFYLELGDKTLYFPLSQLAAVETDHRLPDTGAHGSSTGSSIDRSPLKSAPDSVERVKSVAVLVLGCLLPQYEACLDVIERTWAASRLPGIDVFYAIGAHFDSTVVSARSMEKYVGRDAPPLSAFQARRSGDVIICGCADTIQLQNDSLLRKRLIAFNHLLDTGAYDFVYTVCASSYVDQARLRDYVESVDGDMLFHGPVGICEFTGRPYVSGASMLFSIDMIKRIVADSYRIIDDNNGRYADDVALGSWIARHVSDTPQEHIVENIRAGQRPTGDNTFVMPGSASMVDYVAADPARQVPVDSAYHYHFKTDTIGQMAEFHRRFFA